MAVNLASKYSTKVDERFTLASLTQSAVNNDYDWTGVSSIKVYSIDTVALGNYSREGLNRFGVPNELGDTVKEYILSQDKSFAYTIDKGNDMEQMGVKNSGRALRREIDEQVIPAIDIYRLSKMVAGAGKSVTSAVTKENAYESFLDANSHLTEKKVPLTGRIAFVTPSVYKFLKLDDSFVKASDIGQSMLITGQVGMVDGVAIVLVRASYLPENVEFVVTHKVATVAPKKLEEYRTHIDPPGISGILAEGRVIHDAFVLENKKDAIYVCKKA
jgi:N4-gp56 family major capsid protein